jgi:DNA-directed RNA polymerase III subunit RPC1
VDQTKTKTNHIMEIFDVLGIEAARTTIVKQIKYIFAIYAIQVDIRHINLLADVMTTKGKKNFPLKG